MLDLADNKLTSVGATELGPALSNLVLLSILDLDWNPLGPEGMEILAEPLAGLQVRLSIPDLSHSAPSPASVPPCSPATRMFPGAWLERSLQFTS